MNLGVVRYSSSIFARIFPLWWHAGLFWHRQPYEMSYSFLSFKIRLKYVWKIKQLLYPTPIDTVSFSSGFVKPHFSFSLAVNDNLISRRILPSINFYSNRYIGDIDYTSKPLSNFIRIFFCFTNISVERLPCHLGEPSLRLKGFMKCNDMCIYTYLCKYPCFWTF